jgi:hypothetical protein
VSAVAKASVLEITLSVAGADGRAIEDGSSGDRLVIWVKVRSARKIRPLQGGRLASWYRRMGARPDRVGARPELLGGRPERVVAGQIRPT